MKFNRLTKCQKISLFITDKITKRNTKFVGSSLWPADIKKKFSAIFETLNLNDEHIIIKSARDENWYTFDNGFVDMIVADNELADLLDKIDYFKRHFSQVTFIDNETAFNTRMKEGI